MAMSLDRAVSLGDEPALTAALLHLAGLECRAGNWPLAARHAADGYECAEQLGREQDMSALLYASALVDACLGRVEEAREAAQRGIELSESCGDEVFRLQHLAVLGFLELSVGDAAAADRILRPLAARLASSGWREPSIYGELPNAIEALVELGEFAEARRLLADLQDRVSRIESPWGEASAGRCEGLILAAEGDLEAALAAYARALRVHERLPQPFDLARTLLALGRAQRRARERRAARETFGGRSRSSRSSAPRCGRRRPERSSAASAAALRAGTTSPLPSGVWRSWSPRARKNRRWPRSWSSPCTQSNRR